MRLARHALLTLVRGLRSGELGVLLAALAIGVAALTAVGFFTDRVAQVVAAQAGEVLAADLRLESPQPISTDYAAEAEARGLATAGLTTLATVVYAGESNSLAALRAASGPYPLRGELRTAARAYGTPAPEQSIPEPGTAWADPRLLGRLGIDVGARIQVGEAEFAVARSLEYRPDQGFAFVSLAPTLLINAQDLPATALIRPGSRVTYAALFAGAPAPVADFEAWLREARQPAEDLEDVEDASPQISSSIDRAQRFLSLAALTALLLAAVAVAMAARRHARRSLDHIALLKCCGASQRQVIDMAIVQLAVLALAGGAGGAVLGYAGQLALQVLLGGLVPESLPPPRASLWLMGPATAVIVLIGFALPSWLALKRVPPARVLSRNLEPPPLRYGAPYLFAAAALTALAAWLVRDAELLLYVLGGLLLAAVVLGLAGFALVRALGAMRGGAGMAWRYGIANVVRRGTESTVQVVAFGLGLMVLLLLGVVRGDLLQVWRASLPERAPNFFVINLQPEERETFEGLFRRYELDPPQLAPLVRARMTTINGRPAEEIDFASERARAFMRREANLTWAASPQDDNAIVAGRWWPERGPSAPEVSVEIEIAERLQLELGDVLGFDVGGEPIDAKVTSFREVDWDSFNPNFFMVFSPGIFADGDASYISSFHVPAGQRSMMLELGRALPGVTVIDLESILQQVRSVMDRASLAVQSVFAFTLVAGLAVLLAAAQATRDERRFESALLRTLGASRGVVRRGVAAEFLAIGALAGLLAGSGAAFLGWLIATRLLELEYAPNPWLWLLGALGGALLVGSAGWLATRRAVSQSPALVLRE